MCGDLWRTFPAPRPGRLVAALWLLPGRFSARPRLSTEFRDGQSPSSWFPLTRRPPGWRHAWINGGNGHGDHDLSRRGIGGFATAARILAGRRGSALPVDAPASAD